MRVKPIIEELTDYHREQLRQYRHKWEQIVLSTKPAERELTERGIALAYDQVGLGKPKIVWCGSPLSLALTVTFLKGVSKGSLVKRMSGISTFWQRLKKMCVQTVLDDVRNAVASMEINSLLNYFELVDSGVKSRSIRELDWSLGTSVYEQIFLKPTQRVETRLFHCDSRSIASPAFHEILSYLGYSFQSWQETMIPIPPLLEDALDVIDSGFMWDVSRQSANRLILSLNQTIDEACKWTLQCASETLKSSPLHGVRIGRYSILDFSKQVFALNEETKELDGVQLIMQNADWCVPFENCCFACERPTALCLAPITQWIGGSKIESVKRLHNESGPAVSYPDGWSMFSWYGVEVPEYFITAPHTITIAQIENERNVEVRRLMMQRFGQARFISESGAQEIHRDDFGVLYRKKFTGDDEPLVMVKVTNKTAELDGTYKEYFLRVPPDISTAKAAVAWTFNMDADEYAPILET